MINSSEYQMVRAICYIISVDELKAVYLRVCHIYIATKVK